MLAWGVEGALGGLAGREGGVTSKMLWWVLHSISILLTPFILLIMCVCHLYCVILIKIISKL